jgi:hypothetical protein
VGRFWRKFVKVEIKKKIKIKIKFSAVFRVFSPFRPFSTQNIEVVASRAPFPVATKNVVFFGIFEGHFTHHA